MIGADIVEFNPNEAQGPLSAVTAAKFVKELAALATRTQGNGAA
jgi:arginase family enzyme